MNLQEISEFIRKRLNVPVMEAAKLAGNVRIRKFEAQNPIFRQGDVGEHLYLILSGIAYVSYLHSDGREKVKRFVKKGDTVAPYVSLLTGDASRYGAYAIQPCLCLEFRYRDYMSLVSKSWALETASRKELERQILEREEKEFELFMFTAEERYQAFQRRHSTIAEAIPLKLVASYINVDPATLSRIRARKAIST